ncbi:MAG: T9SS type B sorting domain-containing protein [Chitinophagaceae bacterium]
MKEVCRSSDGGYLMGGNIGPTYQPAIVKLDKKGAVEWNKAFANDLWWVRKVIATSDGNFVVATISYNTQLTKFANDGTIIWSKEFINQDWFDLRIDGIQELPDGGFMLLFNGGYGGGKMYNYLVRLDANINVVWKRKLIHRNYEPMIKSLLVEGDAIFIAADFYNDQGYQQLDIARLSLTTGDFVWKQRLEAENPHLWDPHLAKINDTLVLSVFSFENPATFDELNRLAYINVDAGTGHYLSSYRFENLEPSYNSLASVIQDLGPCHFSKTADNNLLIAQQIVQNNQHFLNVTKFTTGGKTLFSKNYINNRKRDVWSVQAESDGFLLCGRSYTTYGNLTDSSFLMKIDLAGDVISSPLAPFEKCYNEPNTVELVPTSLKEVTSNFLRSEDLDFLAISDFLPQLSVFPMDETRYCNSITSTCRSIEISGEDSVCLSAPVTFTVKRETGCTSRVSWSYDNALAKTIALTDSSITLEFISRGLTKINATMSGGCSGADLFHEKQVEVFRNAKSLELGPDKNSCFPAALTLNAGKGFMAYHWNNGGRDSFVTVTTVGKYYVEVMDACGNFFTDTILVSGGSPVPLNIGPDRFKCNEDTLKLSAPAGFVNYSWGPDYNLVIKDPRNVVVQPVADTSYYVRAEISPGCFAYDTVRVTVKNSPQINLGADMELCEGESVLVDAGPGFDQYHWNDGQSTQQVIANAAKEYRLYASTADGCMSSGSMNVLKVWPTPTVQLNDNMKLCKGSSITLDAGQYAVYTWQDGSSSRTFSVRNPGRYYVTVLDQHHCSGSDTARITEFATPPSNFLPKDTALCAGETIILKPAGSYKNYLWNDNNNQPAITVTRPGLYWLDVTDNDNCTGRDSVVVAAKNCVNSFFVPSAFTPDGNGNNDFFRPLITGNVKQYRFSIFDRSGQVLFTTSDPAKGWDGSSKGVRQPGTVFVWTCTYQLEGTVPHTESGTVLLIR